MMVNTNELKAMIIRRGFILEDLSKEVGINRVSLSKKINNKCEFKASEILRMQRVLQLSNADRDSIFFNIDVI
ncbi:MAG: hypothetical protein IKY26_04520 [Erysipelotrichaceae bacterium]|nr:hypothetical protein [Erysipelotrichaceae bacterium]